MNGKRERSVIKLLVDFKTMNTKSRTFVPVLDSDEKHEIALDGLEFAFTKSELKYIQKQHNQGIWFTNIAQKIRRDEYEVLIAIMHMLKQGRKIKPLNLEGVNLNDE